MEFHFSERMLTLKPSVIREILKSVTPDMIAFAAGNPSTDTFPIEEMGKIAGSLFADEKRIAGILQYGVSEGYQPLRDVCLKRMREKYQTGGDCDELIITSGGQQAIDLLTKAVVAPGDTVIVQVKVKEGDRQRLQAFEGVVIAKRNRGLNSAFTVRKISNGVGVERTFQTYSPIVDSLSVKRRGDVRKAKLYYLRALSGKAARIKEKLV